MAELQLFVVTRELCCSQLKGHHDGSLMQFEAWKRSEGRQMQFVILSHNNLECQIETQLQKVLLYNLPCI